MKLDFSNRYGMLLRRTSTHLYLAPHPDLRPFIAHYTLCLANVASPPPASDTLTLIPDASGCLVLSPGDGALAVRLYGPSTVPVTVRNDLGQCPLRFFVEFLPGGLRAFLPVPLWELSDQVLPAGDLSGELSRFLEDGLSRAPDLDEFVLGVDRGLRQRCQPEGSLSPLLLKLSRGALHTATARDLSAETCYSQRHLSRLFRERAGLSAKAFFRVLRINAAVRCLEAGPVSLTRLAQDLGYYDQSHFTHDFRQVCGAPPTLYQAGMADFYKEPMKL